SRWGRGQEAPGRRPTVVPGARGVPVSRPRPGGAEGGGARLLPVPPPRLPALRRRPEPVPQAGGPPGVPALPVHAAEPRAVAEARAGPRRAQGTEDGRRAAGGPPVPLGVSRPRSLARDRGGRRYRRARLDRRGSCPSRRCPSGGRPAGP